MIGTKSFKSALFLTLILAFLTGNIFAQVKISRNLSAKLHDDRSETLTVIVSLKDTHSMGTVSQLPNHYMYRHQKMKEMINTLFEENGELFSFIDSLATGQRVDEVTPLWLSNAIVVKANESVIAGIIQHNDTVKSVHLERIFHLEDMVRNYEEVYDIDGGAQRPYTYGLEMMNMHKVAEVFPLLTGRGIRVGHIDTGVNPNHPDLAGKVVAFRDFVNGKKEAYDDNDHGTHTAGTIAGGWTSGTRIGVAPEVELIVAKVFDKNGYGTESGILKAMEWVSDPDGNPDTPDGPLVVSNSWGGSAGSMEEERPFWDAVSKWVSLGIFPCFAAGNAGPKPQTIGTPGGYPHAFAVGATDGNDLVAYFSSRGPIDFGTILVNKPDVSAPGVDIYSSVANGSWAKFSGTSMATPHVAGLVALLYQADPGLTIDEIVNLLIYTAYDIDARDYDLNTGWGRVNAGRALGQILDTQIELPF